MRFNITSVVRNAGHVVSSSPMCERSNVDIDHETASRAFIPFGHESDVGPTLPAMNEGGVLVGGHGRRVGNPSL